MMKRKLILTGAALSLAVAMTGCGGKPVINQQPSSQEKNAVDTQAQTETTAPRCRFCHNAEFCRSYCADGNRRGG